MSNPITLYILSTRQQVVIPLAHRAVLGRSAEVEDDGTIHVDLSPFLAYQLGVSRDHLILAREGNHITVTDLGSSNGSYINGARLTANEAKRIEDGDEITLGSLSIRLYVNKEVPYSHMQTRTLNQVNLPDDEAGEIDDDQQARS